MKKFLLIISVCISIVACDKDRPEWIDSGGGAGNEFSAVGVGDTKLDAVATALGELSRRIESEIESIDKSAKDETLKNIFADTATSSVSATWFGKVKVQSMVKSFMQVNESTEITGFYQETVKINLGDSLNSYELKFFGKEITSENESKINTYMEATGKNLNFASLLNELKEAGLKIRTYETEVEYYVLLIYGRENLKK